MRERNRERERERERWGGSADYSDKQTEIDCGAAGMCGEERDELGFHVTETEHTSVFPGRVHFLSPVLTLCPSINHTCVNTHTHTRPLRHARAHTPVVSG